MGCSADSCCHARPSVVANSPNTDQNNVCRNAVISVTFDMKMNNASLNNNFLLLSESPDSTCPAGTSHLALGGENIQQNIFARIYNQIIRAFKRVSNSLARLFNPNQAIAYDISPALNYCVTPGITIFESTSQNTILKFTPTSVLQANTNYVAVVKGQQFLDSLASSTALNKAGVLSSFKVGMAGSGLNSSPAPINHYGPFGVGGPTFANSYSWHFKTLNDNNATSGLCLVDSVNLTPPSYIFQKNTSDDVNENDAISTDNTFDTVADRDKLYSAQALSASGLELQPISGVYSWTWLWTINDTSKLTFANVSDLPANGNRRLLKVQNGITDAQTLVTAQTVMGSNAFVTPNKSKQVPAYIFVCSNPWPAVNNIDEWQPSRDLSGLNYGNYSYEFYYCRDAGDPNTTADDLPAISSGNDIINLGLSDRKVCSNDRQTECTVDGDCAEGGFCVPDILKESYFFQQ
jgi:hypothetical protein